MKNIISLALLLVSVILLFKHGWDSFNHRDNPESLQMMNELGIGEPLLPFLGVLIIAIGFLLLIPKTFFLGNVLNAVSIVVMMSLALRTGNYTIALIEIPFLALPLILIWLKYPFMD